MHVAHLDLNLLRVFDVLLEERSVTRVGARLGLSQSAVSHALNRLRHALGDELFVRTAQGMSPTPRAQELGPRVHAALGQLQAALSPSTFQPATAERRFVLVAGPYACAVIVPDLVARMAEAAPRAELVVSEGEADLLEQLDFRRADFVIGGPANAPRRMAQEVLLNEELTWVVRSQHPLASGPVTLEDLAATQHVVIARERMQTPRFPGDEGGLAMKSGWEDSAAFEAELERRGLRRRVGVIVPDTYSALAVVRRSDMAALIPRRLAQASALSGRLTLIQPPYQSPPVDLSLLYLRDRLQEPAVAWMRDLLRRIAGGLESGDPG